MYYALSWFAVIALLALWSLAVWALHAAFLWTVSSAGALSGAASGAGTITVPGWLALWLPPEVAQWASRLMEASAPLVDSLLQAAPSLAGGLTVATWVIWSVGSVLLVLLGAGLHLLLALWRRRGGSGSRPRARSSLATG